MASTFVVASIIADVANLSNCPPFATNTRITLAQATYWLTQSAQSLSALIRQNRPEDRELMRVDTLYTQAGLRYVSLSADCGEVHAIVWQRGTNDAVLLHSAQQDDLAVSDATTGWSAAGVEPRWRLEGQVIALYPLSGSVETLTVYYTTHITTASATFQAQLDFDRWVTLDVCVKVASSKNKPDVANGFMQQRAILEAELLARARKRETNAVHTIRDVRPTRTPWWAR